LLENCSEIKPSGQNDPEKKVQKVPWGKMFRIFQNAKIMGKKKFFQKFSKKHVEIIG
jgi:hypothetical protein